MSRRVSNDRTLLVGRRADILAFPWTDERSAYFGSGREALTALLRGLGLKKGDTVLLPGFIPEGAFAPFVAAELCVVQYQQDEQLDPDWPSLERHLADAKPKVALLIHYFGCGRAVDRFAERCHAHGALVIEDVVHAMIAKDDTFGRTGDFILHSLPKLIGVPDGAVLELRNSRLAPTALTKQSDVRRGVYVFAQSLILVLQTAANRIPPSSFWRFLQLAATAIFRPYHLLMSYYRSPTDMSATTRWLLSRTPWLAIIARRRALEAKYESALNPRTFRRFSTSDEPAEGRRHALMGFPVRVACRDALVRELGEHGISGVWFEGRWDFFPRGDRSHEPAINVMKSHFLFPTSPLLTDDDIDRVIRIANRWAETPTGAGRP